MALCAERDQVPHLQAPGRSTPKGALIWRVPTPKIVGRIDARPEEPRKHFGRQRLLTIWSHCGFQAVPPSSTFFMSIGVGGTGLIACAGEGVAIPMKNKRLTMNDDVCSAEIIKFTSLRSLLNPVHCHPSRDCSASGSDRKDHAGDRRDLHGSNHSPVRKGRGDRAGLGRSTQSRHHRPRLRNPAALAIKINRASKNGNLSFAVFPVPIVSSLWYLPEPTCKWNECRLAS